MNTPSHIPVIMLDTNESLCLLVLKNTIFNSEHLKQKTTKEVSDVLEFLFTKEIVEKVLELNSQHAKREIQLLTKRFT